MYQPIIEVPSTPREQPRPININITPNTVLFAGALVWLLWDKVMKPRVVDKLDGVFAPIEEERRLNNILAQIGIITGADRIVLAAFHNGAIDADGYHLQKLSTVNTYTAPHVPLSKPIKDLPIGRVMPELELMMRTGGWTCAHVKDDKLPVGCKDHLREVGVAKVLHRVIKVGNLPVGIISIQYLNSDDVNCEIVPVADEYKGLLDDLYNEISQVMRRRVVKPSWFKRVFNRVNA